MTKTDRPLLTALRESIAAAAERSDLDGHAKGRHALSLFIDRADTALVFAEPLETISDLLLRRVLKPLVAGIMHDVYEIGACRSARQGEAVDLIVSAIDLAHANGTDRAKAIADAVDAACALIDEKIKPHNVLVEKASDLMITRLFRPVALEVATEAADALADWSQPEPKKKAAPKKKRASPKE